MTGPGAGGPAVRPECYPTAVGRHPTRTGPPVPATDLQHDPATPRVARPGAPLPPALAELDGPDRARFRQVRRLSRVLDSQFPLPGTDRRFGVDAVLGLIPGIGGAAGLVLSAIVIVQGIAIGARPATVVRMVANAGVDAALNAIPVIGWVGDVLFKANERNVALLATHALEPDRAEADSRRLLLLALIGVVGVVLLVALAAAALLVGLLTWLF